jgi:integrase
MVVMFATFARYEEVAALKVDQIEHEERGLVVDYLKGKTYQVGESRLGLLPRQCRLPIDPVTVVLAYMDRLKGVTGNPNNLLFPSFRCGKGGVDMALPHTASYQCVMKQFKAVIAGVGLNCDPKDYGPHSMRRGGVTGAVNNGADDHTDESGQCVHCPQICYFGQKEVGFCSQQIV